MSNMPRPTTPGKLFQPCQTGLGVLPSGQIIPSASPFRYFGAQHLQLLLSACLLLCLRLKKPVTWFPPRLSTGGWLGLSGRDSHPLYVKATYARPHYLVPIPPYCLKMIRPLINKFSWITKNLFRIFNILNDNTSSSNISTITDSNIWNKNCSTSNKH